MKQKISAIIAIFVLSFFILLPVQLISRTIIPIKQAKSKAMLEAKAIWGENICLDGGMAFYGLDGQPAVYSFAVYKQTGSFPVAEKVMHQVLAARKIRLEAQTELERAKRAGDMEISAEFMEKVNKAWKAMRDEEEFGAIMIDAALPLEAVEAYDGLPLNYVSIADAKSLAAENLAAAYASGNFRFVFTGLFGYYAVFEGKGQACVVDLKTLEAHKMTGQPQVRRREQAPAEMVDSGNPFHLAKSLEPQPPFEVKINGVPDYQSCCHECAEHAAGDVLGYWNDRGYPLLIYNGNSNTWGNSTYSAYRLCRVELRDTMHWTNSGTDIYWINDGIMHLCNGSDYGRNYSFQSAERGWHTPQEDYDFVKGAIYSGKPFLATLLYEPYCGNPCTGYHTVTIIGFGAILLDSYAANSFGKYSSSQSNTEYYYLCHDNSTATGTDVRLYWSNYQSKEFIDTVVPAAFLNFAAEKGSGKLIESVSSHPNPFNPETTIKFHLANQANASVAIVNTMGQIVRLFAYSNLSTGEHQIQWKGVDEMGRSVSSGIYFYVVKAGPDQKIGKMLLVR
ncbi:hypothetical protein BMS3Bbin03_01786 [bacterium BMS3Bbin03]|nr:hypothetical protein BMS3Bbin03_01786 [bacterium BMS3Bbin03]